MLADSKGVKVYNYVPRLDILSIVRDVTKCPLKLYIPFTVSREGEEGDLEKTEDGSVACLGIRRKYGGMKGDMCMLREAVNILVDGVGEEIEEAVERSCGEKVGKVREVEMKHVEPVTRVKPIHLSFAGLGRNRRRPVWRRGGSHTEGHG